MTTRARPRTALGHARRTKSVRRTSARLSTVRAGAALALLASAGALYGAGSSSAFEVSSIELRGLRFTDQAAARELLRLPAGANAFTLSTEPFESALRGLPTVADAWVEVRLPGTVRVEIVEATAILVWRVGARDLLVDSDGRVFAEVVPGDARAPATLPVVVDERAASSAYAVGRRLDPIDLDAATRLGSLQPADVGSAQGGLALSVSDASGFVLRGRAGWTAIFGFYTPSLRTPEMIPAQVRLLRSLLLERGEASVARVVLASGDDGVFTPADPSAAPVP